DLRQRDDDLSHSASSLPTYRATALTTPRGGENHTNEITLACLASSQAEKVIMVASLPWMRDKSLKESDATRSVSAKEGAPSRTGRRGRGGADGAARTGRRGRGGADGAARTGRADGADGPGGRAGAARQRRTCHTS